MKGSERRIKKARMAEQYRKEGWWVSKLFVSINVCIAAHSF